MINNTKKAISFVLALALVLVAALYGAEEKADGGSFGGAMLSYAADVGADIPDAKLRAGINSYLAYRDMTSRAPDAAISTSELATITELSLDSMDITNITGLQYCTSLRTLSLSENLIADVGPLSGLGSLINLNVSGNKIADFTALANIPNSSRLTIFARDQNVDGALLTRTGSAIVLDAQPRYPGRVFSFLDFRPPNANGTYFSASNKITYGPINNSNDVKVGYRFLLDITSDAANAKNLYMSGTVTHDVIVPWCDVSFDPGEGEIIGVRNSARIIEGHPLGWLPQAERTGYSFAGWKDGKGRTITEGAIITTNASIVAVWRPNDYTLSYDLNGGDAVTPGSVTVAYDSTVGPPPVPVRRGYTFQGWYERPDGGPEFTGGAIWKSTEDSTVYAAWSANLSIITFDAQGGRVVPSMKFIIYDDIYGTLPTPVYEGKVFDGWFTEPYEGLRVEPWQDVKVDGSQTLYARYTDIDRAAPRPVGVNEWVSFDGNTYRFDKQGVMRTGLCKVGQDYYYFDSEGRLLVNGTVSLSGYALQADAEGRVTNMPQPNRTTVTYAKALWKNSKYIKVKWKKLIGVSGYQVQYALDKGFTKEIGVRDVAGKKTLNKTIGSLAKGKRYYVRVRGYFLIDGLIVPGKYSKAVRSRK